MALIANSPCDTSITNKTCRERDQQEGAGYPYMYFYGRSMYLTEYSAES